MDNIAKVYLKDACEAYRLWGANKKADHLAGWYPLLNSQEKPKDTENKRNINSLTRYFPHHDPLDLIRTMARILEETNPKMYLADYLALMVRIARAGKGYLILKKNNGLYVEAVKTGNEAVRCPEKEMKIEYTDIPQSVIRYVFRTKKTVAIGPGERQELFFNDPYQKMQLSGMILCLPIIIQNSSAGVVFLQDENCMHAPSRSVVDTVSILCRQKTYLEKIEMFMHQEKRNVSANQNFTDREIDVLYQFAKGFSNREIAKNLFMSVNTVKTHLLSIYGKLNVNRRTQAIIKAKNIRIIE